MEKRKQKKLAPASRKAKPVMVRGEAYRPQDDRTLRNVVFHGIRTNQLTTKKGAGKLARDASPLYINRLAAGLQATIMSSPDIKIDAIDPDILEKISPLIDEYFRQVNAASEVIDEKYRQFRGNLGNPDGPVQLGGNDHRGASRKYKYGAIYVSPRGGVYEVHGAIYQKYLALGAESGFLGFPESDEQDTASGTGRFNHFEHGTIYWSLPSGAWAIYGPLRDRWWQMDGDRSYLGFPITDVLYVPTLSPIGVREVSYFERGRLERTVFGTFEEYPKSVVFRMNFRGQINGWSELWLNSRGDWSYSGHVHNDNFSGCVVTAVMALRFQDGDGKALVRTAERSLGGTLDFESRDDDWTQLDSGDSFIRENWDFIQFAGVGGSLTTDTTVGDVLAVLLPFVVVASVAAGSTQVKRCGPYTSVQRDPSTYEFKEGQGFIVVGKDEPCPGDPPGQH